MFGGASLKRDGNSYNNFGRRRRSALSGIHEKAHDVAGLCGRGFPLRGRFLASPLLTTTACLVTDMQMPGMTGVELHRHLVDVGHPIPRFP